MTRVIFDKRVKMTDEQILKFAAQSKLCAVVGGKVDAYYAPPSHIIAFARMVYDLAKTETSIDGEAPTGG